MTWPSLGLVRKMLRQFKKSPQVCALCYKPFIDPEPLASHRGERVHLRCVQYVPPTRRS